MNKNKNFFKTFSKNYYLFEILIKRIITQSLQEHEEPQIDPTDYTQVIKKDKHFQLFRQKITQLEQELLKARKFKDFLTSKYNKMQAEVEKKAKKKEYLDKMIEKSTARKQALSQLKRNWSDSPAKSPPRYLELEENFNNRNELEKSEKFFEALEQNSLKMKSVSKEEISNHSRYYNQIIKKAKRKRLQKMLDFQLQCLSSPVNQMRKLVVEERENIKNSKKSMLAKRKNYAELVKELYPPVKSNLELSESFIKIKDLSPKRKDRRFISSIKIPKRKTFMKIASESFTPKSVNTSSLLSKINSGFFTPKVQSKSQKKNYLNELRGRRRTSFRLNDAMETLNSDDLGQSKKEILHKIQIVEKTAISEGENARFKDNRTWKAAEIEVKSNQLLLESLKAKMKLLDSYD